MAGGSSTVMCERFRVQGSGMVEGSDLHPKSEGWQPPNGNPTCRMPHRQTTCDGALRPDSAVQRRSTLNPQNRST